MLRRAESSVVSVAREYEHSGIGACGDDLPLHWSASSYPLGGTAESGLSGLEQCGLCRGQHATLITDLSTVTALSLLFITPSWWLLPSAVASIGLIVAMRSRLRWRCRYPHGLPLPL